MDRLKYKGYIIKAKPYQLAKDKSWTININIERHTGSAVTVRNFSAANTFPTEEEAIQHCFIFGKQIIDGKAEGCSVDDL
jgi:hypothetical protein